MYRRQQNNNDESARNVIKDIFYFFS